MKKLVIIASLFILSGHCKAQNRSLRITQIPHHEKLIIDGYLYENAWIQAIPATDFIQMEPKYNTPSSFRTEVKVLQNHEGIFFGITCYDHTSTIKVNSLSRDFDENLSDFFGIALDSYNDKRNATVFGVNPKGAQLDLIFMNGVNERNWNALWKVKTIQTESAWIAEIFVPWKTLRYQAGENKEWGINFFRLQRSSNEFSVWNIVPREFSFKHMEYSGKLTSISPPKQRLNLIVDPYSLLEKNKTTHREPQSNFEGGANFKYGLTPNTTLDLTVNPDFAQAEADLKVNNTQRYSIYFPERRSFFLENASVFGQGLNLDPNSAGGTMKVQSFNSRSIGISADGNPQKILGARSLVHRAHGCVYARLCSGKHEEKSFPSYVYRVRRNR